MESIPCPLKHHSTGSKQETATPNSIDATVKQILSAQAAPINAAQKTYDTQAQQQQTNITGLTQALASILQGIAPGVQQTYADATSRQTAFAKGFSDELQARLSQNASNTGSFLQNVVGAPASQVQQVQDQVAPAGAADTLYGLRGYIPASTLNEEGAAYTANAQQLPAIANSQGLQQIGKVQQAQRAQDAQFAADLAKVAGQAPQLHEKIANDLFNQAVKKAQLGQAQQRLGLQASMDAFNQKYKINQQKISVARLNMDSQKFARQVLTQDRSYALSLAKLGISQKSLQLRITAQEYKLHNGGFTPAEMNRFKTDAAFVASEVQTAKAKPTLQVAMQEMYQRHVPLSVAQTALMPLYKDELTPPTMLSGIGNTVANATISAGLESIKPFVVTGATRRGLDAAAVLAVSQMEGAGGGRGDNGTSFGPWQLHIGGALPASVAKRGADYAHKWAWSTAGINYALDQMAKVARGLTGPAAIDAIVRKFERPKNPNAEVAGATSVYGG